MSIFEQEERQAFDLIAFLYQHRKKLILSFLLGLVLAGGLSFLIPKKFMSTGIIYPPNSYSRDQLISNPQFGHETEVDQLMQLLESEAMRDSVIEEFNLAEYYEIDVERPEWKDELNLRYIKDVTFFRSKYMSIVIHATTKQPELSAEIINYIIEQVNRYKQGIFQENIRSEVDYYENRLSDVINERSDVLDRIYAIKDTSDKSNLIENVLNKRNKDQFVEDNFIDSREMEELFSAYLRLDGKMKGYQADLERVQDLLKKPFLKNYVVDRPRPSYKKASPSITLNAIAGGFGTLIVVLLLLAWQHKVRSIRQS